MDLSVRKMEAVDVASSTTTTTTTTEPRNEVNNKKKTLSFSVDRLLKSTNSSSEDSKIEGKPYIYVQSKVH